MPRPLRVALQMDPLSGINPEGDSSFLLGLGAQARGYALYSYQPEQLSWRGNGLYAPLRPTTLRHARNDFFTLGDPVVSRLDEAVDVILLRQDPPFDMGYMTSTYLLDRLKGKVRVVNDPTGVRNAPEKLAITRFPHLVPPTLVTSDAAEAMDYAAQHKMVVAKRLYGNAGKDVFKFKADDVALHQFVTAQKMMAREPVMLQPFLPEISEGDKRVILFNGKPVGAMRRVPAAGNFLANLAQGARAEACDINDRERLICSELEPFLKAEGLYFVGIDIIGNYLIEINVTSPTGLQSINRLYDLQGDARMEHIFWENL